MACIRLILPRTLKKEETVVKIRVNFESTMWLLWILFALLWKVKLKLDCVYHFKCTYWWTPPYHNKLRPYYKPIFPGRCIVRPYCALSVICCLFPLICLHMRQQCKCHFFGCSDVVAVCLLTYPFCSQKCTTCVFLKHFFGFHQHISVLTLDGDQSV